MASSTSERRRRFRQYCLHSARVVLLGTLVYATWRFGGVDAIALWHVSLLLILCCLLTLFGHRGFGSKTQAMPVGLLLIVGLSVLWPLVQLIPLPHTVYNVVATGHQDIERQFTESMHATVRPLVESVGPAATEAGDGHQARRRTLSVVDSLTKNRVSQLTLMAAFVLLSALLFDSRESRGVFLWVLAINAALIAAWGLIQRSTGSTDLLPGLTRPSVIMPFGPFVYKNAGGAAIVPGFAAALALLWSRWLNPLVDARQKGRQQSGRSHAGYRQRFRFADQRTVVLVAICGLSAAGLLMSYSRGAWLSVTVALIAVLISARNHLSRRMVLLTAAGLVGSAMLIVIATTGLAQIAERVEDQLSANYIYADARWDHWKDGLATARTFFPAGAGLGTYGYASLTQQQTDSRLWFREAHNHYLETLAEQGLPGLLVLLAAGLWLIRTSYRLLTNRVSRERSAIGLVGLAAIVAISVHSIVDFVITIPALLFLFATLAGVVAQSGASWKAKRTKHSRSLRHPVPEPSSKTGSASSILRRCLSTPLAWVTPALIALVFAQSALRDRLHVEWVMQDTEPAAETAPNDSTIDANLRLLADSIDKYPGCAELHQRRAYWHFTQFRAALREISERSKNPLAWSDTSASTLFQKLMTIQPAERAMVIKDFNRAPSLREPLGNTILDSLSAIECNPFAPQAYMNVALLAPAVSLDPTTPNNLLVRLARSDSRMQFMTGMVAHYVGDQALMLDQWRRSLRGYTPELPDMVRLCLRTMSLKEIFTDLVPPNRSVLYLPIVLALEEQALSELRSDPAVMDLVEARMTADSTRTVGQQQAHLGWIWNELDRTDRRLFHWKAAVDADKVNADYRFQYCRALLAAGDYREVLRQSALGQSLEPQSDRFHSTAGEAKRRLTIKTGRRSTSAPF